MAGVLRVRSENTPTYSVSSGTDLSRSIPVQDVLIDEQGESASLLQTPEGIVVYVAVPVQLNGEIVGAALVGRSLSSVLDSLRASSVAHLTLYDRNGTVIQTTLPLDNSVLVELSVRPALIDEALNAQQPLLASVTIERVPYRNLYVPLSYGGQTLGLLSTLIPDNIPFASAVGRQVASIFAAMLAGAAVIVVFVGVGRVAARLERVRHTARSLSAGLADARTGMRASDEVGAVGQALDQFAQTVQRREDQFQTMLRRERRERNYMLAVLESMPDGVVVQDQDGRVILMNQIARQLLGTQQVSRWFSPQKLLHEALGDSVAPGIYALGDPQKISHNGKMLRAQAATVLSANQARIGMVILVRDITQDVQREQEREQLLSHLSEDIQQPLASLAQSGAQSSEPLVNNFAREISRHAAALQKMIVDMRELTRYSHSTAKRKQRPLLAETLLVAVANDWRQIAQAADLQLQVSLAQRGDYVLGDESRLRWAIGNFVDNAIKYTLPGGRVSLELREEVDGMLHMRVRDNGVGIAATDLGNIFMPFYRGTPTTDDGQVVRVPGMGQGLPLAKQIIEAHGGQVKVKSKVNVGTAVYFSLPITAGVGYQLPLLDAAAMEGETLQIAENLDVYLGDSAQAQDDFWLKP